MHEKDGFNGGQEEENRDLMEDGLRDPTLNPGSWEPTLEEPDQNFTNKVGKILKYVNIIGIICSVIALSVMGIKYMVGSIEEKSEYKKAIIPYVLGMIMLAAATTLPNIIYSITTEIIERI